MALFLDRMLAPEPRLRKGGWENDRRARGILEQGRGPRRDTEVRSIEVLGGRAVVRCTVTFMDDGRSLNNLRIFVRREGEWKLLGWANEPTSVRASISR
jgi:hypothetical protein